MITSPATLLLRAVFVLIAALALACGSASGTSDTPGEGPEVATDAIGEPRDGAEPPDEATAKPDGGANVADVPVIPDAESPEAVLPDAPAPDRAEPGEVAAPDEAPDATDLAGGEIAALDAFVAECATDADCDDGDPCSLDLCAAGACGHAPAPEQSPCSDGDPCTAGDTCSGGACLPGGPVSCDDGNPCTLDECGVGGGCSHWALAGRACDDGDPCTVGDACLGGACQPGPQDACPVCPDSACSGAPYETCVECPADCGACAEACTGGVDDDLDGLTDCADPECANGPECLPAACQDLVTLACGGSADGSPGGDSLSDYTGCSSAGGGYGDDDVYRVVLPEGSTLLTATLYISDSGGIIAEADDLDLYVLRDACSAAACVDAATSSSQVEEVSADGTPGQVFYVVVELYSLGFWGYGDYTLYIDCY